jgi:hypothetical protein
MRLRLQVSVEGGESREVSAEISGSLSQREDQLRELFREAEGIALEQSLRLDQPKVARPQCCGRPMNKIRLRSRQLLTPAGWVTWSRRVYGCPQCGLRVIPLDDVLGVPRGQLSPRLANVSMDYVQVQSYDQAMAQLARHHGVTLPKRTLVNLSWEVGPVAAGFEERIAPADWPKDGVDRLYVGCDGVMACSNVVDDEGRLAWREVKVGCCFWYDVSGALHKRLLGRIESAETFGPRLRAWAEQCGLVKAKEVVFIGDGAEWIWNIASAYFNDARTTWVLDWYHLSEHLWEAAQKLWEDDPMHQSEHVRRWQEILAKQGGRSLWRRLVSHQQRFAEGSSRYQTLNRLLGYLGPRLDQTDYAAYRERGLCIGSGAVESAGKQLVVQRAKGPGMHWTPEGLQAVLSLRAIALNGDWQRFWQTEPLRNAA